MRTLAEDGWRLVAQGITTVEEVLSVTTDKETPAPRPASDPSGAIDAPESGQPAPGDARNPQASDSPRPRS